METIRGYTTQVQLFQCRVIPQRAFDAQRVLEVVTYWQQRNYVGYRAHRKLRIPRLIQLK